MFKIILGSDYSRKRAIEAVVAAPDGHVFTLTEPKRSNDQSAKMWAMLTDISRAEPMGRKHTPDDWKAILMNACGWECQFIEGLDGRPFPQGFRSSQLTKGQMSSLIESMFAFGAEHGVAWSDIREG
jgi:hypothetical protein